MARNCFLKNSYLQCQLASGYHMHTCSTGECACRLFSARKEFAYPSKHWSNSCWQLWDEAGDWIRSMKQVWSQFINRMRKQWSMSHMRMLMTSVGLFLLMCEGWGNDFSATKALSRVSIVGRASPEQTRFAKMLSKYSKISLVISNPWEAWWWYSVDEL